MSDLSKMSAPREAQNTTAKQPDVDRDRINAELCSNTQALEVAMCHCWQPRIASVVPKSQV